MLSGLTVKRRLRQNQCTAAPRKNVRTQKSVKSALAVCRSFGPPVIQVRKVKTGDFGAFEDINHAFPAPQNRMDPKPPSRKESPSIAPRIFPSRCWPISAGSRRPNANVRPQNRSARSLWRGLNPYAMFENGASDRPTSKMRPNIGDPTNANFPQWCPSHF